MSVLPDVGSELSTDSDAAVVCTARVDEVMDDALDVVVMSVGQSCVRTDSEDSVLSRGPCFPLDKILGCSQER